MSNGYRPVPANTNEVGLQLAALGREMDKTVAELKAAEVAAAKAKLEAERLVDRAFTSDTDGSIEARKARARLGAFDERLDAEVKAVAVRALVWQLKALQSRIDVGRTIGAGIRKESELGAYGPHA